MLRKLRELGFEITPSALEVINGSKIPVDEIVAELKATWRDKEKILTVEETISLVLAIKDRIKESLPSVTVSRVDSLPEVPRLLRRTFFALKQFSGSVTAGHIVRKTRRKKSTEIIYLNQLAKHGFITKEIRKDNQTVYKVD
ncbi:MAG: hypothetical protein ACFFE8_14370 [Candidatus Heimdallarchaeota archaeon]